VPSTAGWRAISMGCSAGLPYRMRLQRLLRTHRDWCQGFLAEPSLFTVIDSYGIEWIHPIREGCSEGQIGKKGKSNGRWMVGMKLCWLINAMGRVSVGYGIQQMSMTGGSCPW